MNGSRKELWLVWVMGLAAVSWGLGLAVSAAATPELTPAEKERLVGGDPVPGCWISSFLFPNSCPSTTRCEETECEQVPNIPGAWVCLTDSTFENAREAQPGHISHPGSDFPGRSGRKQDVWVCGLNKRCQLGVECAFDVMAGKRFCVTIDEPFPERKVNVHVVDPNAAVCP